MAHLLVDGVLAEEPERGADGYDGRALVLINGLGTVKYEEPFVFYGRIAERLEEAGITPVPPEVGELVTSLDMAGMSLTITFLHDLEELWTDPVDTIYLRRGAPRSTSWAPWTPSPGTVTTARGCCTARAARWRPLRGQPIRRRARARCSRERVRSGRERGWHVRCAAGRRADSVRRRSRG